MTIKYKIRYQNGDIEEKTMKISNGNPRKEYAINSCISYLFSKINSEGLDARFPSDFSPKTERLYAYQDNICLRTYFDFEKY